MKLNFKGDMYEGFCVETASTTGYWRKGKRWGRSNRKTRKKT